MPKNLKVALACVAGFGLLHQAWTAYDAHFGEGLAASKRLKASFTKSTEITPEAFPTACGHSNAALCVGKFIVWPAKIRTGVKSGASAIEVKTFNGDADLDLSCRTDRDFAAGQEIVFHGTIKELHNFLPDEIVNACVRPASSTLAVTGHSSVPIQAPNGSRSSPFVASVPEPPSIYHTSSDTEATNRNNPATVSASKGPAFTSGTVVDVGAVIAPKVETSRATQSLTDERQAFSGSRPSLPGEDVRSPQPEVQRSIAYKAGHDARTTWELWYNAMAGQFRDGAGWWAEHRSTAVRENLTCETQRGVPLPWVSGCQQARSILTPSDQRRRTDGEFKDGWNGN